MKFVAEVGLRLRCIRRELHRVALSAGLLLASVQFGFCGPLPVPAQELPEKPSGPDQLSPTARRAYAELMRLRVSKANALLLADLRAKPRKADALLVSEGVAFAELVVSQDPGRYAAVVDAQDRSIKELGELPRSALRDYALGEVRLHQAAAQVMFGHELQGAWSLRQAYLQVQQNARRWPDYLPTRKTLGLCQFLIGSVPEGYRWFLNLLGLPGNTRTGLAHLRAAAQRPHDFQTEAQILLALINQTYYSADDEAIALTERLAREQPDNLLFSYLSISVNKKLHRADQALAAYRARPTGAAYLPVAYLHHMAADLLLYQGQYAASVRANQQFLNEYPGAHYRKDAWFKMYLAHWLSGDQAAAESCRQIISSTGQTVVEEDRYAQRFVDDELPLNRHLTRARLQLDGGYFRAALMTLNGFQLSPNTPLRDKLEEPYRRARAYHGLGRLDSARLFYARTIALSGSAPYYFAPQSALQLGYLHREAGQPTQAKLYFQKALTYSKHEYKTSTDAKAKVALASLK